MTFNELLSTCVPEGANYRGAYVLPETQTETLIEYDIDGVVGVYHFTKLALNDYFKVPVVIETEKPLTTSEIFKRIEAKFHLGLEEGVDYLSNGVTVSPSAMVQRLSVLPTSYGYTGSIPVLVVSGKNNLTCNDKIRSVRNADVDDSIAVSKLRLKLGWKVFESKGKLFNGYMISITFRELLKQHLSDVDLDLVDDLIYGHVEKAFNDGLSDLIMVRTPKARLYLIRFSAQQGDVPNLL